ncbi:MAG: CocE/NonD family hydrolase [Polyangia bacterium]
MRPGRRSLVRLGGLALLFGAAARGEAPPSTGPAAPAAAAPSGGWALTPLPPQPLVAEGRLRGGASSEARKDYVRSHYTKYEFRVPMRDGKRLFTSVYVPNDAGPARRYPMLMVRTPYSVAPYGASRYRPALGPFESYDREGFIFVYQDARGCYMSEGEFENVRPQPTAPRIASEATDTYDTIEWLLRNVAHHNGRVGMWGISYPGFYAAAGSIDSHPALKAVSPQAPIGDWFLGDDMHRHGAFALEMAFGFFAKFGLARPQPTDREDYEPFDHGTPDTYRYFLDLGPLSNARSRFGAPIKFWDDFFAHPNYDSFWQERSLPPRLRNVRSAMLVVGGWYDSEDLYGPLKIYEALRQKNPMTPTSLIIGPWIHGGWSRTDGSALGDSDFGMKTSEIYAQKELGFFLHHLKGAPAPELPAAYVFETGANRWRSFDAWPPRAAVAQKILLQAGGRLSLSASPPGTSATGAAGAADDGGFDEYISDPSKPVPCSARPDRGCLRSFFAEDQRFTASRPDVLVYATEPLADDLTIAGPLEVELFVSTTGSDADFVVKLIDVNPDRLPGPQKNHDAASEPDRGGQQTLLRGEPFRARFRDSYSSPQPLTPGQVTRVRFVMNDVFHTFQRKHRLMVQVQSSWFPFIDRNPQTFVPSIYQAEPQHFVKATHRIHRGAATPSGITVRVLPGPDAPRP